MQNENRDLRDRIEILESVIGAQTYDLNQDAWRDLLYPTSATAASSTTGTASGDNQSGFDLTDDESKKSSAPPMVLGQNNSNAAISQMAQELIEYRKGTSQKASEMQRL